MPSPFISVIKEVKKKIIITPDLKFAAVAKNGFDVLVVRIHKKTLDWLAKGLAKASKARQTRFVLSPSWATNTFPPILRKISSGSDSTSVPQAESEAWEKPEPTTLVSEVFLDFSSRKRSRASREAATTCRESDEEREREKSLVTFGLESHFNADDSCQTRQIANKKSDQWKI